MANIVQKVEDLFKSSSRALTPLVSAGAQAVAPQNRKRAAVIAHDGYLVIDTWATIKPTVFWGSLAGVAGSGVMFWKRRHKGPEAWGVWVGLGVAFAAIAWFARPESSTTSDAQGSKATSRPPAGSPALDQVTAWLDQRAAKLDQEEPGWDQQALARVLGQ